MTMNTHRVTGKKQRVHIGARAVAIVVALILSAMSVGNTAALAGNQDTAGCQN